FPKGLRIKHYIRRRGNHGTEADNPSFLADEYTAVKQDETPENPKAEILLEVTSKNGKLVYFRAVELALSIPQDPVGGMPVPNKTDTLRIGMELEEPPDDLGLTISATLVSTENDSDGGYHHVVQTKEGAARSRKFYLISKNKVQYPE